MQQQVSALIATDGIWTGYDWYDSVRMIGVENGVPYSNDAAMSHLITAPKSRDSDMADYLS